MAHETGTASDPVDLLNKLRLFCVAQGITINEYRDEGVSPGKLLSVTFNGGYFSIGFEVNTFTASLEGYQLTQASGWNSSTAWGSQPNETVKIPVDEVVRVSSVADGQPIGAYHFTYFAGGVVMVNLLNDLGAWRHFCFGSLEKYGTYTGGSIILGHFVDAGANTDNPQAVDNVLFGMHPNTIFNNQRGGYIRVDDADTTIHMRKIASSGIIALADHISANMSVGSQSLNRINGTSPSAATQASSLHPIAFTIPIADGSTKFSPVGVLRDVRFCNIQYLDNEQIFDTDWLAFCQGVKNDPNARPGTENTGFMGIVVKVQ